MSRNPVLPLNEAVKRPLKNMRVAASTSFSDREINAVSTLLNKLRSGGDIAVLLRSPEIGNVTRKFESMKAAVERQRMRRDAKAKEPNFTKSAEQLRQEAEDWLGDRDLDEGT